MKQKAQRWSVGESGSTFNRGVKNQDMRECGFLLPKERREFMALLLGGLGCCLGVPELLVAG